MRHFHPHSRPAKTAAVQGPAGVFRVARVLELDEGKARGVAGHPDIAQGAKLGEGRLDFVLGCPASQVPHVHFAIKAPLPARGRGKGRGTQRRIVALSVTPENRGLKVNTHCHQQEPQLRYTVVNREVAFLSSTANVSALLG